jgi:hypothetical protein
MTSKNRVNNEKANYNIFRGNRKLCAFLFLKVRPDTDVPNIVQRACLLLPTNWFCQTKVWTPFSESLYVASDIRNLICQKNRISLNPSTNV